jgi:hypothetical protein
MQGTTEGEFREKVLVMRSGVKKYRRNFAPAAPNANM